MSASPPGLMSCGAPNAPPAGAVTRTACRGPVETTAARSPRAFEAAETICTKEPVPTSAGVPNAPVAGGAARGDELVRQVRPDARGGEHLRAARRIERGRGRGENRRRLQRRLPAREPGPRRELGDLDRVAGGAVRVPCEDRPAAARRSERDTVGAGSGRGDAGRARGRGEQTARSDGEAAVNANGRRTSTPLPTHRNGEGYAGARRPPQIASTSAPAPAEVGVSPRRAGWSLP